MAMVVATHWRRVVKLMLLFALAWYTWKMVEITLQYVPIHTDVAFLRIKQDYVGALHYRAAFFTHVFSSVFVLLAGFTQFSPTIRRRWLALHRWAGWFYTLTTLGLAAPSGFVIGLYANGGTLSRLAFCSLAIAWWTATLIALIAAKQGRIAAHRAWMVRSYALALSAITLRIWKMAIVWGWSPRPMDVYRLVAWLGWLPNLLFAEAWLRITRRRHRG